MSFGSILHLTVQFNDAICHWRMKKTSVYMFQQLNSLKPQKTIRPPRMMSHSLDGSRKAQIVQIPMISRINPNNSTSPGLRQHIFLFGLKNDNAITSFYSVGRIYSFLSVDHQICKNQDQDDQDDIPYENRDGMYNDYRTGNSHRDSYQPQNQIIIFQSRPPVNILCFQMGCRAKIISHLDQNMVE